MPFFAQNLLGPLALHGSKAKVLKWPKGPYGVCPSPHSDRPFPPPLQTHWPPWQFLLPEMFFPQISALIALSPSSGLLALFPRRVPVCAHTYVHTHTRLHTAYPLPCFISLHRPYIHLTYCVHSFVPSLPVSLNWNVGSMRADISVFCSPLFPVSRVLTAQCIEGTQHIFVAGPHSAPSNTLYPPNPE